MRSLGEYCNEYVDVDCLSYAEGYGMVLFAVVV